MLSSPATGAGLTPSSMAHTVTSPQIGSSTTPVSLSGSPRHGSLDGDASDSSGRKVYLSESTLDTSESLDKSKLHKTSGDRSPLPPGYKMSRKESLKEKKKTYRSAKKEVAREVMNSASDKSIVLMADWLKVRGTLKGWTKLWCVCRPAMLVIYKSHKMKTGHWVGTILLSTCQLLQRPSKKEGYCFKLFHPLDQSIWATKGPKGETIGAFVQPLPMSYAIFRAPSENQGKCWMDALELALLRCTTLIPRTPSRTADLLSSDTSGRIVGANGEGGGSSNGVVDQLLAAEQAIQMKAAITQEIEGEGEEEEAELEVTTEHFSDDDDHSSIGLSESDFELAEDEDKRQEIPKVEETFYIPDEVEELGQQGDASQTETVDEENKSLIWTLVKQVRPGMDLSKVVLPTFILEPRSFLDKLADYYYHADILSQAVQQETALERMKMVVKWYLSGFYKKPKGLKKPYNPIIGETFRCYWVHPETKSRTFYVAEQISHHPPVSAFHVTNRHDGFNINGCILAKSKFYGNSISAILDGVATLTFLERGEDYLITMPYAHCKGILVGTLTMEMGGKVTLDCPKTGYHCDLDFKLKPFFGNGESANRISGRIRMGNEVLCTFEGHWDGQVYIKELTNRERVLFWDPDQSTRAKRLVRHRIPLDAQEENESERLWKGVSDAVINQDMHTATDEKYKLEERQRQEAKQRHRTNEEWVPTLFSLDPDDGGKWIYKHVDARPWDSMTDCVQYEKDHVIQTQTVHTVSPVRQVLSKASNGMRARRKQQQVQARSPPGASSSTDVVSTSNIRTVGQGSGGAGRRKVQSRSSQGFNHEEEEASSSDYSADYGIVAPVDGGTPVKSRHEPHSSSSNQDFQHQQYHAQGLNGRVRDYNNEGNCDVTVTQSISQYSDNLHSSISERMVSSSSTHGCLESSPAKQKSQESFSSSVHGGNEQAAPNLSATQQQHTRVQQHNMHKYKNGTGNNGSNNGVVGMATSSLSPVHRQHQRVPQGYQRDTTSMSLSKVVSAQQEMQSALQELVMRVGQVQKALGQVEGHHIEGQGVLQGQGEQQDIGQLRLRQRYSELASVGGGEVSSGTNRVGYSDSSAEVAVQRGMFGLPQEWVLVSIVLVFQTFLQWYFSR